MTDPVNAINIQIKKEEIVDIVSRMVKDHDSPEVGGMTEIPMRFIKDLDQLLFELGQLENKRF